MAAPSDDSDAPDDEGTSDTEDATSDGATPRTPSRLERLLSPAAARTDAPTTNAKGATTKWSVDRLDSRERMYGYVAGVAAVVFGVLIYAVDTHKHLKPAKGQLSPTTTLVLALVGGLALIVATRVGRRALVGFVALFTVLGFSSNIFLGLPFLLLAVWLLYRSYKVQKAAATKLREDRAAGIVPSTTERVGRGPRAAAANGKRAAESRSGKAKAPAGPEANKRYTPKKPPPKAPPPPKPSWRERRAAKASD